MMKGQEQEWMECVLVVGLEHSRKRLLLCCDTLWEHLEDHGLSGLVMFWSDALNASMRHVRRCCATHAEGERGEGQ